MRARPTGSVGNGSPVFGSAVVSPATEPVVPIGRNATLSAFGMFGCAGGTGWVFQSPGARTPVSA